MSADSVWVLGIHMTKFGKHKDKDITDLASEACLGALADAGVTMSQMQVMACGNLMQAHAGLGQQVQKQIGQYGIPVYNVTNACATGATALRTVMMAIKAGEADLGIAVGVEKLSGAGLLAGGSRKESGGAWRPEGRFGAVAPLDGLVGTETMPGVFAQGVASADAMIVQDMPLLTPSPFDPETLNAAWKQLEDKVRSALPDSLRHAEVTLDRFVEMRYRLQVNELRIPAPPGSYGAAEIQELIGTFEREYEQLYGQGSGYPHAGFMITAIRVSARAQLTSHQLAAAGAGAPPRRRADGQPRRGLVRA